MCILPMLFATTLINYSPKPIEVYTNLSGLTSEVKGILKNG